MAIPRVGGEVDTLCGRCKLELAHTILAMMGKQIARVRCNTCGSDHLYRAGVEVRARAAPARMHRPTEKVSFSYADKLAAQDPARAVSYHPKERYAVDQLINHPTFGLGIVTGVREDKVDVAFKTFTKTLVHTHETSKPHPSLFKAPAPSPSEE
jgi:hypothetical protein